MYLKVYQAQFSEIVTTPDGKKRKTTVQARVVGNDEVYDGLVTLAVKVDNSFALEALVEKFHAGHQLYLSTRKQAPGAASDEQGPEMDSESLETRPDQAAVPILAMDADADVTEQQQHNEVTDHGIDEEVEVREAEVQDEDVQVTSREPRKNDRIKVNSGYYDITFRGPEGIIAELPERGFYPIRFDDDLLNQDGTKRMRKTSFKVLGNGSL